jgi:hypothetical protein
MSVNFGKFWIQMICVACYVFVYKQSVICFQLHRPVHPLSTRVCGYVHSPYSGIQSKKVVRYFSKNRFIMAYQLYQSIYSMSIVASTCHWVFSYQIVNAIIFHCICLFFTFPVLMQVRYRNHQWIPAMLYTCKCDEECWWSQLPDHCKNSFLVLCK